MDEAFLLLNPGPVPVDDAVLEALSDRMISHRSPEFESIYRRAKNGLDYVFTHATETEAATTQGGQPLILNGTATMAMEAAVANLVEASDDVVAVVNGKFGRRFARIADRHADCTRIETPWGAPIDVDAVAAAVDDDTDVVTMVHNETSTGLLNPVAEVGAIAAANDASFVVDGVTSIGGDEFRIDDWHVDVAITDAQKALAAPPGISALYATPSALDAFDGPSAPFYQDLEWYHRKATDHQTPFTSAVSLFRALAVAVDQIRTEGMPTRIARHRRQSRAFRAAFTGMGLDLFPTLDDDSTYSNTVTAVALPDHVRDGRVDAFFEAVADHNVSIAGGQAHLSGEVFRVSNMGHLADDQIRRGIHAIGSALETVGANVDVEAGLTDADRHLRED